VIVIGAPFNSAGRPDGVAAAPRALRHAGLMARLSHAQDAGDVDVGVLRQVREQHSGLLALDGLLAMTASLSRTVAGSLRDGEQPLVIGGDCPVLLGCLRGCTDAVGDVGLLFVDGHEDAWPPARSTTGEAADCELGLILGLYREELPETLTRLLPTLDPRGVVALGPRDLDELTAHAIDSLADVITIHTAERIGADDDAATACAVEATDRILSRVRHWWLHIDLDVLSTEALPAVDYAQSGGLSWSVLEAVTAAALNAPGCLGITVCIYNPDLDPNRAHARRIVEFVGRMSDHWQPSA